MSAWLNGDDDIRGQVCWTAMMPIIVFQQT